MNSLRLLREEIVSSVMRSRSLRNFFVWLRLGSVNQVNEFAGVYVYYIMMSLNEQTLCLLKLP